MVNPVLKIKNSSKLSYDLTLIRLGKYFYVFDR